MSSDLLVTFWLDQVQGILECFEVIPKVAGRGSIERSRSRAAANLLEKWHKLTNLGSDKSARFTGELMSNASQTKTSVRIRLTSVLTKRKIFAYAIHSRTCTCTSSHV